MPELPEVETIRSQLSPLVEGRTLKRIEILDARWTRPDPPGHVQKELTGARVLGLPQISTLAPGQQADIAIFTLDEPRHFGMHDPLIAPVTCAGSAKLRYLLIGGRIVVEEGAIPGLDLQKLKSDAARVVKRLAA